jgi:hypothetical protein
MSRHRAEVSEQGAPLSTVRDKFYFVSLIRNLCDCGFEIRQGNGCLSLVSVVCCQVEVYTSCWSFVLPSVSE